MLDLKLAVLDGVAKWPSSSANQGAGKGALLALLHPLSNGAGPLTRPDDDDESLAFVAPSTAKAQAFW